MNSAQRVLMTVDPLGGVWTYAMELARSLQAHRYEIVLASMGGSLSGHQREEVRSLPNVRLFEKPYRLEWMDDPWAEVDQAGEWLLELAEGVRPDCVHLNGYAHASLPWGIPVVVVAHSCVCTWWRAVHGESAPPRYDTYRERVQAGLHSADLIVAPTGAMLEMLRETWSIDPRKARVIWNGRSLPEPCAGERMPCIFSAGRIWDEAKNISFLNEVASGLETEIMVAGEACAPSGKAGELCNLTMLGSLGEREMRKRLAGSMIYASPARYEPFGLSILEAALSGCALVLSDLPGFRELWGEAAVYVSHQDASRWREVLRMLLNNRERCAELGARARNRAQRYTPRQMADGYHEAYGTALASFRSCCGQHRR